MKIHKLKEENSSEFFKYTECGMALHLTGGNGSYNWDDVNCLRCLHKKGVK